jgi:magnesium chelatase subunit D
MVHIMTQAISQTAPSLMIHAGTELGSASPRQIRFPFAAVVGHEAEKRALLLLAIEPRLRGVLIATMGDSTKSILARAFGSLVTLDDDREYTASSLSIEAELNTVQLPIGITEDRLLGGLELEQTLATGKRQVSRGLLARAHGRVLYVEDVNLLDANTVAHVAHALDCRRVPLEREGISAIHEADFMFLGTFNPAEGEPSALLRDRIALIVNSNAEGSVDEKVEMIARTFRFDSDTSSLEEDFAFETAEIKSAIETARVLLPRVAVSKDQVRQIALVAMRLGVEGNRADVFALKAARANAALAGRDDVNEDDLIVAIQLVLAPRATTLPSAKAQEERDEESPAEEPVDDDHAIERGDRKREPLSDSIEDILLRSIDARFPEEAISASHRTTRSPRAGTGKRFKASPSTRGRYVSSITRRTRDARVAVDATLRASAPFQLARRGGRETTDERIDESGSHAESVTDVPPPRVKIHPDDLRFKQFKHRSGILFILAVDSSGSMAFNRMAQAKGALTRLLQQAYLHRDKVSLISFRGAGAEVLLAPTRSVEVAKRLLDALPAGGGTPLSAGVVKAIELARFARVKGTQRAMLVLFTDGRANVPLRGDRTPPFGSIEDELRHLGALLGSEEITSIVVDTKLRFVSNGEGESLARILGARYVYLPRSDALTVHRAIMSAAELKQR